MSNLASLSSRFIAASLVASCSLLSAASWAQTNYLPMVKVGTAELVSPDDAWTYYQGQGVTSPLPTRSRDPLIRDLARALRNDPDLIYKHIRNNVEFEATFGLKKGAEGVIIDRSGNAFDMAHLMVELLRESGYTARYVYGTISLSATQFADWFGTSHAEAARKILADGGIPATVSGTGASLSAVQMAHIWVEADIDGGTYVFDPAFRAHSHSPPIDILSAMGWDGASFISASRSGLAPSHPWDTYSPFDKSVVYSELTRYTQNLASYAEQNFPGGDVRNLVGDREIVKYDGAPRRDTALSYATAAKAVWTNEIPYALRTRVQIDFVIEIPENPIYNTPYNETFYADEIYAHPLIFRIMSKASSGGGGGGDNTEDGGYHLIVRRGDREIVQEIRIGANDICCNGPDSISTINQTVNHPYAAQNGMYMDTAIAKKMAWNDIKTETTPSGNVSVKHKGTSLIVVYSTGRTGPGMMERFGDVSEYPTTSMYPDGSSVIAASGFENPQLGGMLGQWLAAKAAVLNLSERIHSVSVQHHHSIGIVESGFDWLTRFNVDSAISVNHNSDDMNKRDRVASSIIDLFATLEGHVQEVTTDRPFVHSIISKMDMLSGTGGRGPIGYPSDLFYLTPDNWAQFKSSVNWCSQYEAILDPYFAAGFHAIGAAKRTGSCKYLPWLFFHPGTRQAAHLLVGSAIYTDFNDGEIELYKGTSAPSAEIDTIQQSPDFLEAQYNGRANLLGVDQQSGEVTLSPPPDFVIGQGPEPYSLAFQRSYKSGAKNDTYPMGRGWNHNWDIGGSLGGSFNAVLRSRDPVIAADAVAALAIMPALENEVSQHEARMLSMISGIYYSNRFRYNIFTFNRSNEITRYFRLSDGSFRKPFGAPGELIQTGGVGGCEMPVGSGEYFKDFRGIDFVLTTGDGRRITMDWKGFDPELLAPICQDSRFKATKIEYPQNMQITFGYADTGVLYSVSNSIGHTLSFSYASIGAIKSSSDHYKGWGNQILRSVMDNFPGGGGGSSATQAATFRYDREYHHPDFGTDFIKTVATLFEVSVGNVDGATPNEASWVQHYAANHGMSTRLWGNEEAGGVCSEGVCGYADSSIRVSPGERTNLGVTAPDYIAPPGPGQNGLRRVVNIRETGELYAIGEVDYNLFGASETRDAAGNATKYFLSGARGEVENALGQSSVFHYDRFDREVRFSDALGRVTTTEFDGRDRVVRNTAPGGNVTEFEYDQYNNKTLERMKPRPGSSEPDIERSWTYTLVNTPLGTTIYDRVSSETDAEGRTTDHAWYNTGQLHTVTGPAVDGARPVTTVTYNSVGLVATITDPTGMVFKNTFQDATNHYYKASSVLDFGRLNLTTTFQTSSLGDLTGVQDPEGHWTYGTYDGLRRLIQISAPENAVTKYTLNSYGFIKKAEMATGDSADPWAETSYTYYDTGRVHTETDPDGDVTTYDYDALNRPLIVTDPVGRKTKTVYDAAGQTVQQIQAFQSPLEQVYREAGYGLNGELLSVKDANGNVTSYEYDGHDRLAKSTFPDGSFETAGYDRAGNMLTKGTRRGDTLAFNYDALNRMTARTASGASGLLYQHSYEYDLAGREKRITRSATGEPDQEILYNHDTAGRVTSETAGGRTLTYQYDGDGNRTRLVWPDGYAVSYTYDGLNRMRSVLEENSGQTIAAYSYDRLSRLTNTSLAPGNDWTADYSYEKDSDLSRIAFQSARAPSSDWVNFDFAYTRAGQLTSKQVSDNRYLFMSAQAESKAYTANNLNQYTDVDATALQYDPNGNLTGDGANSFAYDADNRLISAAMGSGVNVSYLYDPKGRRVRKTVDGTVTSYLLDGDHEIAEYDGAGVLLRRYIYGPGTDRPVAIVEAGGAKEFYHQDRLGNVIALTDESGAITTRYAYDPYGVTYEVDAAGAMAPAGAGQPFRYTGRRFDSETGLYYYRARYYSASLGRFLQTDPVGYEDQMNLYAYVGNDPVNASDPSGQCSTSVREMIMRCPDGMTRKDLVELARKGRLYRNSNDFPEEQYMAASRLREAPLEPESEVLGYADSSSWPPRTVDIGEPTRVKESTYETSGSVPRGKGVTTVYHSHPFNRTNREENDVNAAPGPLDWVQPLLYGRVNVYRTASGNATLAIGVKEGQLYVKILEGEVSRAEAARIRKWWDKSNRMLQRIWDEAGVTP